MVDEYTFGAGESGIVILKGGVRLTAEEIVNELRVGQAWEMFAMDFCHGVHPVMEHSPTTGKHRVVAVYNSGGYWG